MDQIEADLISKTNAAGLVQLDIVFLNENGNIIIIYEVSQTRN